jgi:acyl-CoA thioesterase-1
MPTKIIKTLAMTMLASMALIGCQPAPEPEVKEDVQPDSAVVTETQTAPATAIEDTAIVSSEEVTAQPITILALGDSLTEGLGLPKEESYPAQLEAALKQAGYSNVTVVNSGLSGETSTGLVNRVDWALKTKPDITILTVGANDAMRGIEVDTIESNIRNTIERLQASGSTVILGGMQIYQNLGNDYVKTFSDMYPRIAEDTGVAFIPFFLEGVAADAELNQDDAIHPTKEGYTRIVSNNIIPVLKPVLTEVVAKKSAQPAA